MHACVDVTAAVASKQSDSVVRLAATRMKRSKSETDVRLCRQCDELGSVIRAVGDAAPVTSR